MLKISAWLQRQQSTVMSICSLGLLSLLLLSNAQGQEPEPPGFACLKAAYPEAIKGLKPDPKTGRLFLEMADGVLLPWNTGPKASFDELLNTPDMKDMLSISYPKGREYEHPKLNDDPGRVRFDPFFKSLYGASRKEVAKGIERVIWLPKLSGKRLRFNGRQGAAEALRKVSADLEKLPKKFHKYINKTSGTFNWRKIKGTQRLSSHSYAVAIDINIKYTHYWRWTKDPKLPYQNKIPMEIVEIFERHGFIWGGKWYHYDTMHFEYRPDLLHPACLRTQKAPSAKGP